MSHNLLFSKPKAIAFDWDETLAASRPTVVACLEKILKDYGLPNWDTIKKEKRDKTKSLKENFYNFFGEQAKEAYQLYLDYYQECFTQSTVLLPQVRETLERLVDHQITLLIVSNKDKLLLLKEVDHLLKNIPFWKILGESDAPENKPSGRPIEIAFKDSDITVNPKNVWVIGDSQQDTDCAYNANCLPILIGSGQFMTDAYKEEKRKANPPLINLNDFKELLKYIESPSFK